MATRQVILDTETTGLSPKEGHRIIEIGCVELKDRQSTGNTYHQYINPERKIDRGAVAVHGITNDALSDKPVFADIADVFFDFIEGSELVIHNAPFDVSFIEHEFKKHNPSFRSLKKHCSILDTLVMARKKHPGQRNSLDALCKRYHIDNSERDLHGALLDAQLLARVYLLMTGGQTSLFGKETNDTDQLVNKNVQADQFMAQEHYNINVVKPNQEELALHQRYLKRINEASNGNCLWLEGTDKEDG